MNTISNFSRYIILFTILVSFQNTFADTMVSEKQKDTLPTVVVKSDPFGSNVSKASNPISIVQEDELKPLTEGSLGETLRLEPGVNTGFGGSASSRPIIRGLGGERLRVLRNGIGTQDASNFSEDHAVTANPFTADSVEILRGSKTLLYGNSAIGGIVNVVDGSIPETRNDRLVEGGFDLRQRTNDDELSGAVNLEGGVENFSWHIDFFHQDANNYDIPGLAESDRLVEAEGEEHEEHADEVSEGTLQDSFYTNMGFTAGGSYVWNSGFFGIALNGYDSRYGVPAHVHGEEHGHDDDHGDEDGDEHHDDHEDAHHDDDHDDDHDELAEHADEHDDDHDDEHGEEGTLIELTQWRLDYAGEQRDIDGIFNKVRIRGSLSNYDHSEGEGDFIAGRYSKNAFENRVELFNDGIVGDQGILALQTEYYELENGGEEAFLPGEIDSFAPGIFYFESMDLSNKTKVQAGGRLEYANLDPSTTNSQDFVPFSGSVGIVHDPLDNGKYSIGASLAYTERAPGVSELFANGAHLSRQAFEIGDEGLGKERSVGVDVSAKKNSGVITGGVSVFAQYFSDFINLDGTGAVDDGLPVFMYEAVDATFLGFELEQTVHFHEIADLGKSWLDAGVQLDYVHARAVGDDDYIPRIPPFRTIVSSQYGYDELFSVLVEGVFAAAQRDTSDTELTTDAYQVLNAQVDVNLPITDRIKSALYVRGTNLTDEEVRIHSSFIKDQAPLRGRAVLFGIRGLF